MFYGKSKKVIVIDDIHSNLIESAILVLKGDKEREEKCNISKWDNRNNNNNNDFILRKAELIIDNYIKENKSKLKPPKKIDNRNSKLMKNVIINSALIGSIVAVVFLLLKLF